CAVHVLEQQQRPLAPRLAAGDLGDLVAPVDLARDALHVPLGVTGGDELPERVEAHSRSPSRQPSPAGSPIRCSTLSVKPDASAARSFGFGYQGGETGAIPAPSRESLSMFPSAIPESGVSRTHRMSRMRSFSATAAARVMSVSEMPAAIFASVEPLHGRTTMAS